MEVSTVLRRSSLTSVALFFALIIPVVFAATVFFAPTEVARGKSAAVPLSDTLTPDQQLAQDLALADSRVQAYTTGQRTEVFGVAKFLDINTPINKLGCGTNNCRVVNIFNFDASATVQAFVRLDTQEVVEVYYQPGVRPGINSRLADRAMEIALNEPVVIEVIGEQRTSSDWAPMDSTLVGSACERGHMCVAPTFDMGDYIFWAIVDLTDDKFLDTFWTATDGTGSGAYPYPDAYGNVTPNGCPASGSVNRDGWQLDYNNTGTDSMRISNARYNNELVINSAKLVEWHADYGSSGYQDSTGCGGGGGGFPIYPYGDTQVLDLMEGSNVVGFEVVQDFRMGSWGSGCNYRYEQRFEFYTDGRFRTVQGAYGKGCGTNSLYRGLMRIDLAAGGTEANDNIATWNGTAWAPVSTESRWCPEGETNAGCTGMVPGLDSEGYRFRIWDSVTNSGYYMEPGRGQFGDEGQGDNEFVYAVVHNASEGDNDLPVFSAGCCNNYNHGPEQYVNGGNTTDANLVIWYIPQALTDAFEPGYYCWTLTPPTTFPCFTGPMFHPYGDNQTPTAPTASFTFPNEPYFPTDEAIQFTDTSNPGVPNTITWAWTFGDGGTSTLQNPMHAYDAPGTYTVTLTVDNGEFTDSFSAAVEVEADVENTTITLPEPGPGGSYYTNEVLQFTGSATEGLDPNALTYAWDFGDGDSSTLQNPLHAYDTAGNYTVSLTAGNGFFTETVTSPISIVNTPTAVSLGNLNVANGNGMAVFALAAGLALLAGAVVVFRRK
jgi:PKD repeat protein